MADENGPSTAAVCQRCRCTLQAAVLGVGLFLHAVLAVLGSGTPTFTQFDFAVEPEDTVALRERPALLDCQVNHPANLNPQLNWLRNDDELNLSDDSNRYMLTNGSLFFSEVEHTRSHRPDEGNYRCAATLNSNNKIVSREAELRVAYLAKAFESEPQGLSVNLEDVALFQCLIDGAPTPTVQWFKEDVEITSSSSNNYVFHERGVLEVSKVEFADFGRYKCRVTNSEKSRTSRHANLDQLRIEGYSEYQAVPPRFIMEPTSQVALAGSTVTLFCGANGRDRDNLRPQITWLKNGATIDTSEEGGRFTRHGQGTLKVNNVQEEDEGSYTCRATNQEDSVDTEATITVQVPPRFVKRPENIMARETADVEFECEVYGQPDPTIQWLKNGDVVISSDYFQIIDGRNLKILGLVKSDSGFYQCIAANDVGNVQASAQLIIFEKGSAQKSSPDLPSPPTQLSAAIVSIRFITLSWSVPLHPGSSQIVSYSVFWRENGSNRERVLNTTGLEANIQHLKPATQYEFRVLAYNQIGPSSEPARITIQTQEEVQVPGPVESLTAITLSSTSIKVTWQPPIETYGIIEKYHLYYYPDGAVGEKSVEETGFEHTLTGLTTYTLYNFRVVAHNDKGAGESTEDAQARTYSDRPSEPPQNITVETGSSTSLILLWDPPPVAAQNGLLTGYKIRFKKSGADNSDTVTTDGHLQTYAITDLEKGQAYHVRMQALTVNGSGPASPWQDGETYQHDLDESHVPGKPVSLHVRAFSDSIIVSWNPPLDRTIMVRGYTLGYGIHIPDIFRTFLEAKTRIYKIKALEPGSEYVITLRAFNNIGGGPPVYETVFTRESEEPESQTPIIPPVGLKAQVISSTSILLTWSDHTLGRNQRVSDNRYYTIRYQPKNGRRYKYVNSTDLNVHIDDLKPHTEFEFSVRVIKGRRHSTWSLSTFNRTFEDAPTTAPRDLTPVPVDGKPMYVTLNWQPPRQPNGWITGYLIFYTVDNTLDDVEWAVEPLRGEQLSYTVRNLTPDTTYFFKIQARNSKGYSPKSPTVIFRTPKADGTGGGVIHTPDDYGLTEDQRGKKSRTNLNRLPGYVDDFRDHLYPDNSREENKQKGENTNQNKKGGISPQVLWILVGVVGGITLISVIVVTIILCRRRMSDGGRKKRKGSGYKPANKMKPGPKDLKPPDLWIHHEHMELKSIDKGEQEDESGMAVPRSSSHDLHKSIDDEHSGDRPRSPEDRYHRTPGRPAKPIMIPVDQPPPPREPVATATAIPNGHLHQDRSHTATVVAPTPIRPVYPRTQYTNTPRVNAGDISQPSSGPQSPESPSCHNQHAPIPYEQLHPGGGPGVPVGVASPTPWAHGQPGVAGGGTPSSPSADGTKSLPRPTHPLKSFSVPGPPLQSQPGTPTPKPHLVKPQPQPQQSQQPPSPYKKPPPPTAVTPMKSRSPMPVISPQPPDVTLQEGDTDMMKSVSTEELTAEMANLEGLMKDLNAITQQEFEC